MTSLHTITRVIKLEWITYENCLENKGNNKYFFWPSGREDLISLAYEGKKHPMGNDMETHG